MVFISSLCKVVYSNVCFLFKVQTKSELQRILRSCLSVSVVQDVIVVVDIVMLLMCSSDMP